MDCCTDKTINIEGCQIRYREAGKGPFLFLVHGIAGFLEEWEPAMKILSEEFHVIALDLPGHGLSEKPDIAYSIDKMTDYLKNFILSFTTEKIILVGHSLGGSICLNLVIRHPNIVERLIVINSVFERIPLFIRLGSPSFIHRLIKRVPFFIIRFMSKRSIHKRNRITPEWEELSYKYINTPGNIKTMFSIIRTNISLKGLNKSLLDSFINGLKQINIPVLILFSGNDKVVPVSNSCQLGRLIRTSKIIEFKNCGHELQYEDYEEFCREIEAFIR
ncbi:MAG TPA: alpha/beta hydrolase [Clostridia bacterium]